MCDDQCRSGIDSNSETPFRVILGGQPTDDSGCCGSDQACNDCGAPVDENEFLRDVAIGAFILLTESDKHCIALRAAEHLMTVSTGYGPWSE